MKAYIIVPKVLDTNPPVAVTCGFMAAQVHHVTVKAPSSYMLSPMDAVIVLQVPDSAALQALAGKMVINNIKFQPYWETSDLFQGEKVTALITKPTERIQMLERLELWTCNCDKISVGC